MRKESKLDLKVAQWRKLRKAVTITLLVALLAGLIPPPLVRTMLPASAVAVAEVLLPEPAVAQAATYSYEVTPNLAITDNSCPTGVSQIINITDTFTINDLNVGLTIDHTYRNDLDVVLRSPSGTTITLFTDIGSNSTQNFDILLDDEATNDISTLTSGNHTTTAPYYENLFNPEGAAVLSTFDGQNALGNWTLTVCDDTAADTGTLRRFSLQFDGTAPITGTIQIVKNTVADDGTFTFTSADPQLDAVSITTVGNTGNSGAAFTKNPGIYTISEDALPVGWALTGLSCSGDLDNGSVVTLASRQVAIEVDAGESIVCTFTNTYTPPPGAIQVGKQVLTTDGSNPAVVGNFTINVSCPGSTPTPSASQTVAAGGNVTFGSIPSGTLCTISESTLNLPAAPSGYTWVNSQVTPSQVAVGSGVTTTVTARNTLAPLPPPPTNVLTITKTISGTGNGPFNITVSGPSGYISNTTINGGQSKVFSGLVSGIYTVTESSPGAGWTTIYTVTSGNGTANASTAVVNLFNSNPATFPATNITGRVYHDYNSDGQITANGVVTDTGVSGVTVTAYDKTGAVVGTAQTTNATGNYTINPGSVAGPYRVEFSKLPAGYEPTAWGTGNGTSTQFVNSAAQATNVNMGILSPGDYSQANPQVAVVAQIGGAPSVTRTEGIVFGFNYLDSGYRSTLVSTPTVAVTTMSVFAQMGSVWGLAHSAPAQQLFVSATLHRHMGLGVLGSGGIYKIDEATNTVTNFIDLDALGVATRGSGSYVSTYPGYSSIIGSNAERGLFVNPNTPSLDASAFNQVGRVSLGDIDISLDGQYLYVINLFDRKLYQIDLQNGASPVAPSAAQVRALGTPPYVSTNPCINGEARP